MKCFIDSNVLISAGLFPNSVPATAFLKAVTPPNIAFVSDYSLDETYRKINEKFPDKISDLEAFLYRVLFSVRLISTPVEAIDEESKVSDVKDRPILRAAVDADIDVLITGDKKLLASGVTRPRILSPKDFLDT